MRSFYANSQILYYVATRTLVSNPPTQTRLCLKQNIWKIFKIQKHLHGEKPYIWNYKKPYQTAIYIVTPALYFTIMNASESGMKIVQPAIIFLWVIFLKTFIENLVLPCWLLYQIKQVNVFQPSKYEILYEHKTKFKIPPSRPSPPACLTPPAFF